MIRTGPRVPFNRASFGMGPLAGLEEVDLDQVRTGHLDPFVGFYSSVLSLPKVRYCFVAPGGVPPQPPLDLHYLGILVNADEFESIDRLLKQLNRRDTGAA